MFYLTSDIIINLQDGRRLRVKPYSVKWKRSVKDLCDTSEITLPLHPYLYTTESNASSRECLIKNGDKVSVSLGYNGNNSTRFEGYVATINYNDRLVLQCEGYYYLIKRKSISDSWKKVTLRDFVQYIVKNTDITLSKNIPNETLTNLTIQNASMDKVFKMLQDDYLCAAYFKGRELYVGASLFPEGGGTGARKKLRIGWNVKEGKVVNQPIGEIVKIVVKSTDDKGKTTKTKSKKSNDKVVTGIEEKKINPNMSEAFKESVRKRLQDEENAKSLKQADVTCFLEPQLELGEVVEVIDQRYPERNGRFFVAAIDGEFGESGGSQKLTLRYYGD